MRTDLTIGVRFSELSWLYLALLGRLGPKGRWLQTENKRADFVPRSERPDPRGEAVIAAGANSESLRWLAGSHPEYDAGLEGIRS